MIKLTRNNSLKSLDISLYNILWGGIFNVDLLKRGVLFFIKVTTKLGLQNTPYQKSCQPYADRDLRQSQIASIPLLISQKSNIVILG